MPGYIYGAYVREVSLLQREKPAEPGARVSLLYEPKPAQPQRQPQSPHQLLTAQVKQLNARGILVRDCGTVLGVR